MMNCIVYSALRVVLEDTVKLCQKERFVDLQVFLANNMPNVMASLISLNLPTKCLGNSKKRLAKYLPSGQIQSYKKLPIGKFSFAIKDDRRRKRVQNHTEDIFWRKIAINTDSPLTY